MTSDVARLLRWFDDGSLVRPSAGVANTVDLARAIASLCGAPGVELTATGQAIARAIGPAEHYVFVMVDGLGMNIIEALPEDSFLRRRTVMEMQAVFPSSTAPALTSLATGLWPGEHAVPGWFTYLPDDGVTATILPFIERFSGKPLAEMGVKASVALPVPSWLPSFAYAPRCYSPSHIASSTYSMYVSGGVETEGYGRLGTACKAIAARIEQARSPTYSYLYVPYVDQVEHGRGPRSKAALRAALDVDRWLELLAARLAGRGRFVASADHGLTHVERRDTHQIAEGDPLLELLAIPPYGEARVPLLLARAGCREAAADAFRARFGRTHALLTIDQVEKLALLGPGPLSDETRRRLGDFMAISATPDAISDSTGTRMLGYHGGLTADEMRIPLIVA